MVFTKPERDTVIVNLIHLNDTEQQKCVKKWVTKYVNCAIIFACVVLILLICNKWTRKFIARVSVGIRICD